MNVDLDAQTFIRKIDIKQYKNVDECIKQFERYMESIRKYYETLESRDEVIDYNKMLLADFDKRVQFYKNLIKKEWDNGQL